MPPAERPRVLVYGSSLSANRDNGGQEFLVGLTNALAATRRFELAIAIGAHAAERIGTMIDASVERLTIPDHGGARRVVADLLFRAKEARSWHPDVIVYPHEWKPLTPVPTLLVMQNILWIDARTRRDTGIRGHLLRLLTRATAPGAAAHVAVSSVAASMWRTVAPLQFVHVLPEGVSPPTTTPGERRSGILAIVGDKPYKGGRVLAAALDELLGRADFDESITVVGAALPSLDRRVRNPGRVPHDALVALMESARVVVIPSLVESFGIPAFEAVARGAIVVVPAGTAMHEWLGDRVRTYDGSASDLSRALADLPEGAQAGAQPNDRFHWENVVVQWADLIAATAFGRASASQMLQ